MSNTSQFLELATEIQKGIKHVYQADATFVRAYVTNLYNSEGIVLAEIWAVFTADAVQPIRSLDLIVKRGRLQNLDVEMDGFDVTQVVERDDCPTKCSEHAICTRNGTSFECTCARGYIGNGLECIDLDECSVNNGGCQHVCVNNPTGSYHCLCNRGFRLHGDRKQCRAAGGDTAYCEAEWRQDILWRHTVAGAVDIKTCPQDFLPGGEARRECYNGLTRGVWGVADLTSCLTKAMNHLQIKLAQLIEGNYSFSDLLDIGQDLQNILDPKVDKIYAGDIYTTISIMKVLNREANRTMYTNISNEDLTRFLEVRALTS